MTKEKLTTLLASNAAGMSSAAALSEKAAKESTNPIFAAESRGIARGYRVAVESIFAVLNMDRMN